LRRWSDVGLGMERVGGAIAGNCWGSRLQSTVQTRTIYSVLRIRPHSTSTVCTTVLQYEYSTRYPGGPGLLGPGSYPGNGILAVHPKVLPPWFGEAILVVRFLGFRPVHESSNPLPARRSTKHQVHCRTCSQHRPRFATLGSGYPCRWRGGP
jgi:hypothetical protein